MYSNKPRQFAQTKQDISFLPLDEIGKKFKSLMSTSYKDFTDHKQYLRERKIEDFLAKWNASNEGSYEGSFEELILDVGGDFSGLGSEQKDELKQFLEDIISRLTLGSKTSWLFPQMLSEFARLPLVKNDTGLYSAKALLNTHIKQSDALVGMYVLCKHASRSMLIKGQTDVDNRNFCSLVPLVMSAFKKHSGIAYSTWDPTEVFLVTDTALADAMCVGTLPEMTKDEIRVARDSALTPRSGTKAGIPRSPLTTYTLYVTKDYPELLALPPLARVMMCQTWCAHPSNRTEYMITNPLRWDEMPEPLVTGNIFRKPSSAVVQARENTVDTSFMW